MATAVIEGRPHLFDQDQFLASGGEADVYRFEPDQSFTQRFGNGPFVVKLFREEGHDDKRRAVLERQAKLRAFPQGLPEEVVKPLSLACDPAQKVNGNPKVIGYAMPFVTDAIPLIRFKAPQFRKDHPERVTIQRLCRILVNLHALVSKVHQCGVVIGDLNDKNVLVGHNDEVYLLDADSLQYGEWECPAFVPNFVDPKIIEVHHKDASRIKKVGDHSVQTDWYAFAVIAFQLLVRVNPYLDGFCKLKDKGKPIKGNRRLQHQISVFHPEVNLPRTALPLDLLPEAIHEVFRMVFEDGARGEFPRELLTETEWKQCISCGNEHGRAMCPRCSAAPSAATQSTSKSGTTTRPSRPAARTPITLPGQILAVASQEGKLRCVYHHDGAYRREDHQPFWTAEYDPQVSAFPAGHRTVVMRDNRFAIFDGGSAPLAFGTQQVYGKTTVAANSKHVYWVDGSSLVRDNAGRGTVTMGQIVPNLTSVWVGERFGLALVDGISSRILTFHASRPGLHSFNLPALPGVIVDAQCVISEHLAWLVLSIRLPSGRVRNRCYVFDSQAQLHASAEANRGGNTWLGHVTQSAHAAGTKLFVPVPRSGIVRVGFENRAIEQGKIVRNSASLVPDRISTVGIHTTPDGVLHIGTGTITPIS